MKRFSTSKLMSAVIVSLLVVSLVGCKTTSTKVEAVPSVQPTIIQPETKLEQPVQAPVVVETPVVKESPIMVEALAMQYPLGIEPIVKSDAAYPVFDLFIVHTANVQGNVYSTDSSVGYSRLSTMLQVTKSITNNVLVLDAGNVVSGTPIVEQNHGETAGTLLAALGYDAVAPSSGDYAYGTDALLAAAKYAKDNTQLKVLAANVLVKEQYLPFQPYQIYDFNGFKVA
ncbi:MAG: hypothetical protein JJE21_10695, partial [Spirochaetaceae bacterium]|nr:hypothetical protein [Spirochaetaceae bacterium]